MAKDPRHHWSAGGGGTCCRTSPRAALSPRTEKAWNARCRRILSNEGCRQGRPECGNRGSAPFQHGAAQHAVNAAQRGDTAWHASAVRESERICTVAFSVARFGQRR